MTQIMEKNLPDASDAEKWLDPDTFVVKGRVYRLELDFTIVEIGIRPDQKAGSEGSIGE